MDVRSKNRRVPSTPQVQKTGPYGLIEQAREGVWGRDADDLALRLGLTDQEMARVLAVSLRTYHRRKADEKLGLVASERILLFQRLAEHGKEVFEDEGKFNRWLRRPLQVLGGNSPLDLLDTTTGLSMVDTLLGRIEYGIHS
ncbi:type II toxin-antitoxin system Xre/ParS family antitoxin [Telluribacter sp.]|jgi:putative toxin-antitoxin system antitoxin component (TIGR02293 family)|uniref:type II RES/Xre toxin-antitoxin system antitoxin n=1 Tax=Telluribacter sp. TaxID=1978767 RepID=UPI002E13D4E6|nr:antitoxin Xre/MbcA/ParS toxin-binding domain-containing protein [Telluribacter sp.]